MRAMTEHQNGMRLAARLYTAIVEAVEREPEPDPSPDVEGGAYTVVSLDDNIDPERMERAECASIHAYPCVHAGLGCSIDVYAARIEGTFCEDALELGRKRYSVIAVSPDDGQIEAYAGKVAACCRRAAESYARSRGGGK